MKSSDLFEPVKMKNLTLDNRMIMAPLTRSRATKAGVPTELMAKYYGQRASAGLIISEATNISKEAYGYALTPGIFTDEQVEGWKMVLSSVHAKNGKMFCQLWHCGRVSHPDLQPENKKPVAPSAITPKAEAFTADGKKACEEPRALEINEISRIIGEYTLAAENALKAGFDGVEIHSANGYLLHQFISDSSNKRDDQYGGSVENRCRFTLDVVQAICSVIDSSKVGIRLAPVSDFNDVSTNDPQRDYEYLVEELGKYNLAYVHVIEGKTQGDRDYKNFNYNNLKDKFNGLYMANNNYDRKLAFEKIKNREADLICFGRPFIANPDLVMRFKEDAELNELREDGLYGGDEKGYTDYPFMGEK